MSDTLGYDTSFPKGQQLLNTCLFIYHSQRYMIVFIHINTLIMQLNFAMAGEY